MRTSSSLARERMRRQGFWIDYARKVVRIIQTLVTTTASTREACATGELVPVQPVKILWEVEGERVTRSPISTVTTRAPFGIIAPVPYPGPA